MVLLDGFLCWGFHVEQVDMVTLGCVVGTGSFGWLLYMV